MSKRLISFGLILIVGIMACSMLFAASNVSTSGDYVKGDDAAKLFVKWNLKTSDVYEVGFSKTKVDQVYQNPSDVDLDGEAYALTTNVASATDVRGVGEVYVYWKVSSYSAYDIKMKADAPLAKANAGEEDATKKLNWKASWNSYSGTNVTPVESGSDQDSFVGVDYTSFKPVYSHTAVESKEGPKTMIGSTLVNITTANALKGDKEDGEYSSSLTLKITMTE